MARKVIGWGFATIGLYLVVVHFKGFAADESAASTGTVNLVTAFQGR